MTASARRGPAYCRQLPDAPFVDTRFVHVPTPVVPPLDLARLNDAGSAQNLQPIPRPPSTAASGPKLFHDTSASPPGMNPLQMNLAATLLREEHNRPAAPATTTIARDDANLERKKNTEQMTPAPLTSFQEPGLIHPKPPDVPVPKSERDSHGMGLKHESLSARLARLAAGGNSRRVVPIELV